MRLFILNIILSIAISYSVRCYSQTSDTLINVGTYKLNFSITKGKGIPILFESGAGNDGTVWQPILKQIAEITGTTLITYDRALFGKSTFDTLEKNVSRHGIMNGIEDLETGLNKLGYNKEIILVSHSYGGYFSYLYASRHPKLVKLMILIDVVHDFHAEGYAEKLVNSLKNEIKEAEKTDKGMYYLFSTLPEAANLMTKVSIPSNIPVIDFVSSFPFFEEEEKVNRWIVCHKKFVGKQPITIFVNMTKNNIVKAECIQQVIKKSFLIGQNQN